MFEYEKNNKRYWDKTKFYKQTISKTLFIIEVFYLNYLLLFLFNNTISYFIYVNNILNIKKINKNFGSKQIWLYNN